MYDTIYVEKNKSSRFCVYFYKDASQWVVFKDICGIKAKKIAVICSDTIENEVWKTWCDAFPKEEIYKLTETDDMKNSGISEFISKRKEDYVFVVLSDSFVLDVLYQTLSVNESKISMVMVPVTPYSMFAGISIRPLVNETGTVIRKEILPQAVYVDLSILTKASPLQFLDGIASAFKLSISYKASMFEWMISNMYELTDGEEESVFELVQRGFMVWKERIEKDTAKERSYLPYAEDFRYLLKSANNELSEADLTSLALVCQTYLSWKKELLSMEEFYEIRDMFVFFGLSITQTFASVDELLEVMSKKNLALCCAEECVYIRKLGKLAVDTAPTAELVKEALEQIYFDEDANE